MKIKRRRKKNNAGFSLVELLVSIAIFSIVSLAFFEFLMVAVRHYQKETMEVEVQYEAQLAVNQLQDLVIDATRGVSYMVNGSDYILSDDDITAVEVDNKQLIVYNTDKYYIIHWQAAQETLLYSEYRLNEEGEFELVTPGNALMAEYVRDFSVDLSSVGRNNSLELDLTFDNEREYQIMQSVKLRNQVSVNISKDEVYSN